ncbi:hypothetical protein [Halobacillus andaensis]|uniref:hypothetical protein n=1 Tax=Halobacillus andaensis TaxID=1176239 RepID=UPI003D742261
MRQLTTNISLIFLGLCIFAGAWMVSSALNDSGSQNAVEQVTVHPAQDERQLMSHSELKEYLGISDEQLEKILPEKEDNVTKSKIPYIKIDHEYYFSVKAIDKWLTETEVENFQ